MTGYPYFSPYQTPAYGMPQRMELIRVSGIEGAKAYQMPPNSTAALFDGGSDIMFIKSTDGAGFPTIRTFSFTPVEQTQNNPDYVTRKEFDELKEAVLNGKQSIRKRPADATAANE